VKCVLAITKSEAKEACGVDQLCEGLEAGIEGGIHVMRSLWKAHEEEAGEIGFLLVDARNAFNEGNRMAMLWTVRHRNLSSTRVTRQKKTRIPQPALPASQ
jgi:predicted NBD/HSP70 family sugar kinase